MAINPHGSNPGAPFDVSPTPPAAPRRAFLRSGTGLATLGVVAVSGAGYLLYRPGNDRQLVFGTLAGAMQEVERLAGAAVQPLAPASMRPM